MREHQKSMAQDEDRFQMKDVHSTLPHYFGKVTLKQLYGLQESFHYQRLQRQARIDMLADIYLLSHGLNQLLLGS
jgi:hypothetical protein